jgi:hypothetical protein
MISVELLTKMQEIPTTQPLDFEEKILLRGVSDYSKS